MTKIQKAISEFKPNRAEASLVQISKTGNIIQINFDKSESQQKLGVHGVLHDHRHLITNQNHFEHIVLRKIPQREHSIMAVICEDQLSCTVLTNILILKFSGHIQGQFSIGEEVQWWYKRKHDKRQGVICGFVLAGLTLEDDTLYNKLKLPKKGIINRVYDKKSVSVDRYLILTTDIKPKTNQPLVYAATKNRVSYIG